MYEPEPELIRAAGEGDPEAFEQLVLAYQAQVWRFLRHLLGDAALAEDVTQETFVRVYRNLGSFRARAKFSTWLFSVARNAGIDALRARQRRARLAAMLGRRGEATALGGELKVEVDAALASLSPKLRQAFVVVEALGLSYREAADALGVPEGTVKSRVFHARERLVTWMSEAEAVADDH